MSDQADRWRRVEQLCAATLERAGVERAAFLRDACGDDEALRREVEQLLAQESQADGFLRGSVATVAAAVLSPTGATLTGHRFNGLEVGALIGAGGMGEVYRARDTELKRDVALKVLPVALAGDAERLARFRREAEVLASLNHPNIASIYGLEQGSGIVALVMELVEGDDLSERIARGAIPFDAALPIARQIAEALEAAHERGIIHRDLKPANIKVRADGVVKVLDFGLAKAIEQGSGIRDQGSGSASISPTITSPAVMTGMGAILGTAGYMSPEQAKGHEADRRSDIWAFGVVLFEMLTGQRAFSGDSVSEMLAAVLMTDPPWQALPPTVSPRIQLLLRWCLEKDPKRRLRDIADALPAFDPLSAGREPNAGPGEMPGAASWRHVPWGLALGGLVGIVLTVSLWAPWRVSPPPRVTRTSIATPTAAAFALTGQNRDLAISLDGTHVAYVGNNGAQLFIRALDALEPVAITKPVGVTQPFFSPDGQWVGFVNANNVLQKVAITGGAATDLATEPAASRSGAATTYRGATWAPDDTIILANGRRATGLLRIPAAGGPPQVLTTPNTAGGEDDHIWPEVLPGGFAVLFTITSATGGLDDGQIALVDLRTRQQKILLRGGSDAHYVPSGHLVYVGSGSLRAIAFDLKRLETHGPSVPLPTQLAISEQGIANLAVARDGTMVYAAVTGGLTPGARTLVWVDRMGHEEPLGLKPGAYLQPRLSPDGKRVAVWSTDQGNDLWTWDLEQRILTPVTRDPLEDQHPVWTRNGQRIVFSSNRGDRTNLWWQAADGSGLAEHLTTTGEARFPTGLTPDGKGVFFFELTPTNGRDLMQVALDGTHEVKAVLQTPFHEREASVSPDGHWLAYESNSSDSFEVWVRPFPAVDTGAFRISTDGGTRALWARDGKTLFYIAGDGFLQEVAVDPKGSAWHNGPSTRVFERRYYTGGNSGRSYDVSLDGQRFLMISAPGIDAIDDPPGLVVVQHWDEELKRLVPTK